MTRKKTLSAFAWLPLCALLLPGGGRLSAWAQSVPRYLDARTGVEIRGDADKGIFTQEDMAPPTAAKARSLQANQLDRALRVVCAGLAKYPPALARKCLKIVYVVQDLSVEDVDGHKNVRTQTAGFDSTETKRIYINYQAEQADETAADLDTYMEGVLHRNLSHFLVVNNLDRFPETMWKQWEGCNAPGFRYGKETGRKDEEDQREYYFWWKQGFADALGATDVDADVASMGGLLFTGDARFWQALNQLPILKKKADIFIAFCHSLDSAFTPDYFRRLAVSEPTTVAEAPPANLPVSCYAPGDLIVFPHGGKIILSDAVWRVVNVPAGGSSFYLPTGYSMLQAEAGSPKQATTPLRPVPDAPTPPPGCSLLWTPPTDWLLYASVGGLREDKGVLRLHYQAGSKLLFPFGGQIYVRETAEALQVLPGHIEILPPNAIAVFNAPSSAVSAP